jgi:flagellar basal-body rod protein FlgB
MIEKLFNNPNYGMSKTMLDVSTARHDALAANIANVETAGYRRVDVSKSFLQELQQQFKSGKATESTQGPVVSPDLTARTTRVDGNNVDLDTELLQLGSNEMQYEMLTDFVSGSLARLKTAITGRIS